MTSRKTPETLRTKGQPRKILARMRPAFREYVKPHTHKSEGERLGGGSILNARWDHRLSRDLDVYVNLETIEDGRTVLDRAAAACGGYRIEHRTFRRIEFERNKENHIDVSFGKPTPAEGEQTAVVDGEPTLVLSTAQIISGKLQGRGMTAPGRDLLDIAACKEADPEALEIAVNGLPDETVQAILKVYQSLKTAYATETAALEGVPDGLRPVIENRPDTRGKAIPDADTRESTFGRGAAWRDRDGDTGRFESANLRERRTAAGRNGTRRDQRVPHRAGAGPAGSAERDDRRTLDGPRRLVLRIEPERLTRARANVPALTVAARRGRKRHGRRPIASAAESGERAATANARNNTATGNDSRNPIEVRPPHAGRGPRRKTKEGDLQPESRCSQVATLR